MMDDFLNEDNSDIELAVAKKDIKKSNDGQLTIDVYQTNDEIVVQSTIAGVNPDTDIDIAVTKDMVTIKGRRGQEEKIRTSDYYHQELYWGQFSRSVILPVNVDSDRAKASYKNGVLTIRLPKLDKSGDKRLRISND